MTKPRLDGLTLLLLGSAVFVLLGAVLEAVPAVTMPDFKAVFYGARCLVHHTDPYQDVNILRAYLADGGKLPSESFQSQAFHDAVLICINLPTTLFLIAPFALLPFGFAQVLWGALSAGSLIFASLLVWDLSADFAPVLSGALIGFLIANSEVVFIYGNSAGLVTSLCAIAVWCFIRQRFAWTGIVCLAVSLAIKPHDVGLVWLFLLLAGGMYRKRALQSLLVVVALSAPAALWISQIAPRWMQELRSNLAASSAPGAINDPALGSLGHRLVGMQVSLQSAISGFRNDPRFYTSVTYVICGLLLAIWIFATVRRRPSPADTWLALAAIAALTLLPIYHRPYDTKLLLLTVPACAMLWAEGGRIGRVAVLVNAAVLVLTGDLPWIGLAIAMKLMHVSAAVEGGRLMTVLWVFPTPLTLLMTSIFYLWVYVRRSSPDRAHSQPIYSRIEKTAT